ncbi:MAG TPA: tRNA pseudouridine(38-40) synthase TruA [Mycobacteriales bacterium]
MGEVSRLRLDLAYDGSEFSGWAEQPGRRTVAGLVRSALETLTAHPVRLVVAGRTDAGVHATGQVAHADVTRPEAVTARAMNGILPSDVRALGVHHAPPGFDARFGALSRRYAYRVTDRVPDPVRRRDTLAWPRPLDDDALAAAAAPLVGLHDFAAFCRRREGATTIRDLQEFTWRRDDVGVLVATVRADAFCQAMVRSLVGALLAVGEGRRPLSWPASLLDAAERSSDIAVAPAHGLTLVEVRYPDAEELTVRAATTRARRDAYPSGPGRP